MPVGGVFILAHRGGMARGPENTLAAFKRAVQDGADAFECDVRLSQDGEPVIFHDDETGRVAGRKSRISALNWKEIRELRVMGREPVPHLDEVLEFASNWPAGRVFFDLHQDSRRLVEVLAGRIISSGLWPRCLILDFYSRRRLLLYARSLDSRLGLAVMPQEPWHVWPCVEKLGIKTLCLGWDGRLTRFLYKASCLVYDVRAAVSRGREAGAEVSAGVANSEEEARYLLEQGVAGLWTDDVPLAARIIAGRSTHPSRG